MIVERAADQPWANTGLLTAQPQPQPPMCRIR
ncbi:hypothetical protein PtrV1_04318 [Pyrenophora tritici-repentis]|uniref:Uncharacterized protein n=1 Tax=Pyrenophora tritici-repentis TaxID=45151 RepID=A0A5M9LH85_9PLEO|nr:hypothetical protein PtrV1_04318 [Pyrenophora tritici-repentis]KAF7574877.1 hypothetical protein PtrM4_065010 [Pyrenophora tritici-repentis]